MLQAESLLCHAFCEKITQKARQPLRGRSSQLKPTLGRSKIGEKNGMGN